MIPPEHFLILGAVLFCIGIAGVIFRRNALVVLMSIELMLNAVNLTLLTFARSHHDVRAHAFAFFVIAVAAAEAAIGLSILIRIFRKQKEIALDTLRLLQDEST